MTLETSRLLLRPWREEDAEDLYFYAKDPRVGPAAGWPVHTSAAHSLEIIRTVFAAPETYAVVPKETGRPVGSVGLMLGADSNLKLPRDQGELGYWIGVPWWGRGLIPEAAAALIRRGFQALGLTCLWCACFDGNDKSRRVQEKCGFSYHHTTQNVPCQLEGRLFTEHVSRLTREDWLGRL